MTAPFGTTIHCEIDRAEGSLPRLIGLIERRGFAIEALEMGAQGNGARRVSVAVRGLQAERCPEVLGRQIDRLIGVRRIDAWAEGVA
jgi:acetolactate synthase-1/3 small subunit